MEFGFFLRKAVAAFLYPPTLLLVLAFGGLLVARFRRFRRLGTAVVTLSLGGLLLLSIPAFQNPALAAWEAGKPPSPGARFSAIVVLGAGVREPKGPAPATRTLGATAISRAVEGIRLAREHPEAILVFTGGKIGDRPASSREMKALAVQLGIDEDRIRTFAEPTSTREEAAATAALLGNDAPIALVTSALHQRRARLLFEQAGLRPFSFATDFLHDSRPPDPLDFLPSASAWHSWQRLFHEILGILWANLQPPINQPAPPST